MDRKPYDKPVLREVKLKAEEAALTACKRGGGVGPGFTNCRQGATSCPTGKS